MSNYFIRVLEEGAWQFFSQTIGHLFMPSASNQYAFGRAIVKKVKIENSKFTFLPITLLLYFCGALMLGWL